MNIIKYGFVFALRLRLRLRLRKINIIKSAILVFIWALSVNSLVISNTKLASLNSMVRKPRMF